MTSYKELLVWQKSVELVKSIYRITKKYPGEEKFGLVDQMRRASVSIPSNIAEGKSRKTDKEFIQFLYTSRGSSAELETQIYLSKKLGFIDESTYQKTNEQCEEVGRMLSGLIKSLDK